MACAIDGTKPSHDATLCVLGVSAVHCVMRDTGTALCPRTLTCKPANFTVSGHLHTPVVSLHCIAQGVPYTAHNKQRMPCHCKGMDLFLRWRRSCDVVGSSHRPPGKQYISSYGHEIIDSHNPSPSKQQREIRMLTFHWDLHQPNYLGGSFQDGGMRGRGLHSIHLQCC